MSASPHSAVVIGCGLAGLASAWYLRQAGLEVTVVERAREPAAETSFANGSMLTPSLADPWNSPGAIGTLLRSIGRANSPMLLRAKALPSLVGWGLRFARNATRARFEHAFLTNARFAQYSQRLLDELLQTHPLRFEYAPDGTVQLFRDDDALAGHVARAQWLEQIDVAHQVLDVPALVAMEPALSPIREQLAGGIYYSQDAIGNARLFCQALHQAATSAGVQFLFEHEVDDVQRDAGGIAAVRCGATTLAADVFVLAAGSFSWPLGKTFGLRVPIRPAKGYSLTVPIASGGPRYAVVDDALHAAVVPLGSGKLRVAGTAEFTGFDATLTPARIANLRGLLDSVYPDIAYDASQVQPWCGFRPMTPDGLPLIGASRIPNLFLCTGHGPLGWTLACASGQTLADLVTGAEPAFDPQPFSPLRF